MSTPEPITWRLVEYVAERLAKIDGSDGWHTSIQPSDIHVYARQLRDDGTAQMLVQVTSFRAISAQSGSRTKAFEVDLVIRYIVPYQTHADAERIAHRALADIRRALSASTSVNSGAPLNVRSIVINDCSVEADTEGSRSLIAQVIAQAGVSESYPPAIV